METEQGRTRVAWETEAADEQVSRTVEVDDGARVSRGIAGVGEGAVCVVEGGGGGGDGDDVGDGGGVKGEVGGEGHCKDEYYYYADVGAD